MVKLENLLGGISENLDFLTEKIRQYERDLEQSKLDYEEPFVQEAELMEKTARLNELNVQLDLENGKTEDMDMEGLEKDGHNRVAENDAYHARPSGKEGR